MGARAGRIRRVSRGDDPESSVAIVKSIVAAIAAALLALGMIRQREFRVNRIGIQPVAVTIMLVFGLYGSSESPSFLTAIALGVCVGLGIVRATVSRDHIDVSKRCIITKPNVWMAVIFAAAFALKFLVGLGPESGYCANSRTF
jgi:hypothetical protein